MANNNGFSDFQNVLRKINVSDTQVKRALTKGANEYAKRLKSATPRDDNASMAKKYGQMRDNIQVEQKDNDLQVTFGDAFWWRFVEHGTNHQRAQNFARNTLTSSMNSIQQLMISEVLKNMK